jgi:DNA-damage-inducible protein D
MKSIEIKALFSRFEAAVSEYEGIECWSARELQGLLGYTQWRNFSNIIDKAKEACQNAGENTAYHFADVSKTIPMPKGAEAEKEIDDILLAFSGLLPARLYFFVGKKVKFLFTVLESCDIFKLRSI